MQEEEEVLEDEDPETLFLEELEEAGYPRALAKKALEKFGADNSEEGKFFRQSMN